MLFFLKLCLFLLLVSLSSKANTCLPDAEGLCTPGVTIDEQVTVEKTEEESIEFADVVGHISLSSLDKKDKKHHSKNKKRQPAYSQLVCPLENTVSIVILLYYLTL